ncbi:MAG: hypothetical protein HY675_12280 [Chloroflexi bacterium]|nr:hypothetical protein [Chloroflexota bacterium]
MGIDWRERYKEKVISAEQAASLIKCGDRVRIALGPTPYEMVAAIARRRGELENVTIWQAFASPVPGVNWWKEAGWDQSFRLITEFPSIEQRPGLQENLYDFLVAEYTLGTKVLEGGRHDGFSADVFILRVSPPDSRGVCALGPYPWYSKLVARRAKIVIGEVTDSTLFYGGDDFIHVSEIDFLVERALGHKSRPKERPTLQDDEAAAIGRLVSDLVHDGDTIEIGGGEASEGVCAHLFDKNDLGVHTENIQSGMIDLMLAGVVTGARKNIHRHRAVATGINAAYTDQEEFVRNNPAIELLDVEYVNNIRTIASNDNVVAIQSCLSMDLTGQVASESFGSTVFSAPGGQFCYAIGSMLSKGGRSIFAYASTARGGKVSRVVPQFEPGTVVTVPRAWVDWVVTEQGVINLQYRTQRERAKLLISLAHPKFRDWLNEEAERLFWPRK